MVGAREISLFSLVVLLEALILMLLILKNCGFIGSILV